MSIIKVEDGTLPDGRKLYRHYSDKSMRIRQIPTGIIYDEATDVEGAPYTYEETSEPKEVSH